MEASLESVRDYWNAYARDLEIDNVKRGTFEFFTQIKILHDQAYARANALLGLDTLRDMSLLELAPGVGLDTVEFAAHGANVAAVDLSPECVTLARQSLACRNLDGIIEVGDVEKLAYPDASFDVVVARGLFMYTVDDRRLLEQILRVTKPGGRIQILLHNRNSWYVALARMSSSNLFAQRGDPPINRLYSAKDARIIADRFSSYEMHYDRYPSRQTSRSGVAASLFDTVFVPLSSVLPKSLIRPIGFYMIIQAIR